MNQSLSEAVPAVEDLSEAVPAVDELSEAVPAGASIPAEPADAGASAAAIAELREQIDAVDAELITVVQRRVALSKQIQDVRISQGGRRREHSRELKIVSTYVDGLGRGGSQLALTLLELCRGRA